MAVFYLQLTDERNLWTMVRIDDDDDEWDQRSKPNPPMASGKGDYTRLLLRANLVDGNTGRKIVTMDMGRYFREGDEGAGLAYGAMPALKDGIIKWKCTAFYEEDPS